MHVRQGIRNVVLAACIGAGATGSATAFTISFSSDPFNLTPSFNAVTAFNFTIDVAEPLAIGQYLDPTLNSVNYSVLGVLSSPTPSGFSGFDLQRTITGADFYAQGSQLSFEIAANANLADGLQMSELAASFTFNGRELGTGRYHPPYLQLFSDGSGSIQNSTNKGGVNPGSGLEVDVNFGDEYVVTFSTNAPAALTLVSPVPEPPAALMLAAGLLGIGLWRRRCGAGN